MPELCIGLMSGTSMDGVDAVLCEFDEGRFARTLDRESRPYAVDLRTRLLHLQRDKPAIPLSEFCELDNAVAEAFADTVLALLSRHGLQASAVRAIGSHGQTVFHDPDGVHSSLQLGNPSLIAARSSITTVSDFRRADIARGGQGAPLVPAFHHALFATAGEARCVINIGGIANVSLLPDADAERVRGFDTGPGNGLMDEWTELHRQLPFDRDGAWARSGELLPNLLDVLLDEPYFQLPPPKSTGRDRFSRTWLRQRVPLLDTMNPADVQRSLCELTARSIAGAVVQDLPECRRALVCGGGARNGLLMERLRAALPGVTVQATDEYGLQASEVEGAAFAWLALRALRGLPGNLPGATGASGAAVLGGIYPA